MKSNIKKNFRIQKLHERNLFLAQAHEGDIYVDNPEFLVNRWSGKAATFIPATDETVASVDEKNNIYDHNCAIPSSTIRWQSIPKCELWAILAGNWIRYDFLRTLMKSALKIRIHKAKFEKFYSKKPGIQLCSKNRL